MIDRGLEIIDIKAPLWNGGKRMIGIAPERVKKDVAYKIQISYKNKDGVRIYPKSYRMRGWEILRYKVQAFNTKYGLKSFHLIPVDELPEILAGPDISQCHNAIKLKDGRCPICVAEKEEC